MKIAVYTICKDEIANVKDWLKSVGQADYVTVVDTGSSDGTVAALRKHFSPAGKKRRAEPVYALHHAHISPWRFDVAHNTALSLVPADADVCIPLHLDERLEPGWREALEDKWDVGKVTKAFYTYQFAPELTFMQNRIHARNGYSWRYPDHEGIYPWLSREVSVVIPDLKITQKQDRSKDRSGILMRLAAAQAEYPEDARMTFYYARELMYYGKHDAAIKLFHKYFTLPGGFPTEQKQASEHLAWCYSKVNGQ